MYIKWPDEQFVNVHIDTQKFIRTYFQDIARILHSDSLNLHNRISFIYCLVRKLSKHS